MKMRGNVGVGRCPATPRFCKGPVKVGADAIGPRDDPVSGKNPDRPGKRDAHFVGVLSGSARLQRRGQAGAECGIVPDLFFDFNRAR
jgi:hypothetical protein